MSEEKREAHQSYLKLLELRGENVGINDEELLQNVRKQQQKVTMLIINFLCQCQPRDRFRFTEFSNIINDSSRMDEFEPEKAIQAFINMEQYILLLCLMPWKQEFHRIKKFGGFYQCRIESHLRNAETIFKLIGFTEMTTGFLVLTHSTKPDILQYVAFECLVASTECRIITDIWHKASKRNLSISEVVSIRLQNSGSAEKIVSFIESKCSGDKKDKVSDKRETVTSVSSQNIVDCGLEVNHVERVLVPPPATSNSCTATFRDKLQAHMNVARKISSPNHSDIPFMDEDAKEPEYQAGDFDDHLMASLQIVGDKEASPVSKVENNNAGMKPSQEWSFVRDELEKNYGKKYYEGQRKDILEPEKESRENMIKREPPYVQVLAKGVYENIDNSGKNMTMYKPSLTKEQGIYAQHSTGSNVKSVTGDSDYASAISTNIYPPTIPEHQAVLPRPARHDYRSGTNTDTVIRKGSSHTTYAPNTSTKYAKSEPIARRSDPVNSPHFSQSYPIKSQVNRNRTLPDHMDNIRALQKRSSLPVANEKTQIPLSMPQHNAINSSIGTSNRQNATTVKTSAGTGRGMGNFSGAGRSNVSDSAVDLLIKPVNHVLINNTTMNSSTYSRQWSCTYCTFLNVASNVVCEICSKSRDGVPEVDSPTVGYKSRVCDQCTLENETESLTCHACGNELKGTQTVV